MNNNYLKYIKYKKKYLILKGGNSEQKIYNNEFYSKWSLYEKEIKPLLSEKSFANLKCFIDLLEEDSSKKNDFLEYLAFIFYNKEIQQLLSNFSIAQTKKIFEIELDKLNEERAIIICPGDSPSKLVFLLKMILLKKNIENNIKFIEFPISGLDKYGHSDEIKEYILSKICDRVDNKSSENIYLLDYVWVGTTLNFLKKIIPKIKLCNLNTFIKMHFFNEANDMTRCVEKYYYKDSDRNKVIDSYFYCNCSKLLLYYFYNDSQIFANLYKNKNYSVLINDMVNYNYTLIRKMELDLVLLEEIIKSDKIIITEIKYYDKNNNILILNKRNKMHMYIGYDQVFLFTFSLYIYDENMNIDTRSLSYIKNPDVLEIRFLDLISFKYDKKS